MCLANKTTKSLRRANPSKLNKQMVIHGNVHQSTSKKGKTEGSRETKHGVKHRICFTSINHNISRGTVFSVVSKGLICPLFSWLNKRQVNKGRAGEQPTDCRNQLQ